MEEKEREKMLKVEEGKESERRQDESSREGKKKKGTREKNLRKWIRGIVDKMSTKIVLVCMHMYIHSGISTSVSLTVISETPDFTDSEINLFEIQFEEGYDITDDDRYNLWPLTYHPNSAKTQNPGTMVRYMPTVIYLKALCRDN